MGKKIDWLGGGSSGDNIFKVAKLGVETMIGISFLGITAGVASKLFG